MSELGELLELMHGASGRVGSVRATLSERCRPELLEVAFRRFGEGTGFASGGGYFHAPLGGAPPGERVDEHCWQIELWAEPGRFREQRTGPDLEHVLVVDGARWWQWSPGLGLHSHEEGPGARPLGGLSLLDPLAFVAGFELSPVGESVVAGRLARRVRVRGSRQDGHPFALSLGVDEAEFEIDAERGLVLCRTEFVNGQPAFVREVEEISYDGTLAEDTFVFRLPPGESAGAPWEPQVTTLDEVASLAAFGVWKLEEMPADSRVDVIYLPSTVRPTRPESVSLIYSRRDGGERLEMRQTTQAHELPVTGEERCFEHAGSACIALGPDCPKGREPAILLFARDETQIRMSSSQIPLARLLEFAVGLIAA